MRIENLEKINKLLHTFCQDTNACAIYRERFYPDHSLVSGDYCRIKDIPLSEEGIPAFFSSPALEYEFDSTSGFSKVRCIDSLGREFEETIVIRQEIPPYKEIYLKPRSLVLSL